MSVLCTHLPNLLLTLTHQANSDLVGKPIAVLDEDERITTLSAEAAASGVIATMTPGRAQLKCPEIVFQDLNLPAFTQTQAALLDTLSDWELPTEEANWGLAYVDLHPLTKQRAEVQKLASELGGRLRGLLGTSLQPAIGWDSGKFTAKAAAMQSLPGTMKLIDAKREIPFLHPLPVTMLPLSTKDLRWLNRLSIRTLGQFGDLPPAQIQTALGKSGVAAHQWALGKDARPVVDTVSRRFDPLIVRFPHPTSQLAPVVVAVINQLAPTLQTYAHTCRGVRRLELKLDFDTVDRSLELIFVDPTAQAERIEEQLTHQLQRLSWPDCLHHLTITDLQAAELSPPAQLGLFDEVESAASTDPKEWLAGLQQRYGTIRHRGHLADLTHPVAQFRAHLNPVL